MKTIRELNETELYELATTYLSELVLRGWSGEDIRRTIADAVLCAEYSTKYTNDYNKTYVDTTILEDDTCSGDAYADACERQLDGKDWRCLM